MKRFTGTLVLALVAVVAMAGVADAAPFQNGSFEDWTGALQYGWGGYRSPEDTVGFTNTFSITGWTVGPAGEGSPYGVTYFNDYQNPPGSGTYEQKAADGIYSVRLCWGYAGSVSQTFDTVIGVQYDVSFSMSGIPNTGVETMRVTAGPTMQDFTFDTTGITGTNMGWVTKTLSFTADSTSTTLEFKNYTNAGSVWFLAPCVDNVVVTPEPATMVLLGLGGIGLLVRRRRRA